MEQDLRVKGLKNRDQQVMHENLFGMQIQPGLSDAARLRAIDKGDSAVNVSLYGDKDKTRAHSGEPHSAPSGIGELEKAVNVYAGKLISSYLKKNTMSASSVKITPFKIKANEKHGKGLVGRGFDQHAQLADFEAWVGPGNQVLNWM